MIQCLESEREEVNAGLMASPTILLVEDEAFVRHVTGEILRGAGYQVIETKNAVEAACALDQCLACVDLLIADIVLPGESGGAFAGRMRRAHPELKVLLITGYPAQIAAREWQSEECLAKPFSARALLERMKRLLDRLPHPVRSVSNSERFPG